MSRFLLFFVLISIVCYVRGQEPDDSSTTTQRIYRKTLARENGAECLRDHSTQEYKNNENAISNARMLIKRYMTFEDVEFTSTKSEDIARVVGRYCGHLAIVSHGIRSLAETLVACANEPDQAYASLAGEQTFIWIKDYICQNGREKTISFIKDNGIQCFLKRLESAYFCFMAKLEEQEIWDHSQLAADSKKFMPTCMKDQLDPCDGKND